MKQEETVETMEVRVEKHHGKDVFVSVLADAARKTSCLCIHQEDGRTFMCKHLRANVALEDGFRNRLEERNGFTDDDRKRLLRTLMIVEARRALNELARDYKPISEESGICLVALANYGLCLQEGMAIAVTRCSHYEREDK